MSTTTDPNQQEELAGMPERPNPPTHDGRAFRDAQIRFAGGIDLTLYAEEEIDYVEAFRLEESFDLRVSGTVSAKHWKTSADKDGNPKRALVVTLKVNSIQDAETVRVVFDTGTRDD